MYISLYDWLVLEKINKNPLNLALVICTLIAVNIFVFLIGPVQSLICVKINISKKKTDAYKAPVKQDKNTPFTDISITCWNHSVTVNFQRHAKYTERDHKFQFHKMWFVTYQKDL